MASQPVAPGAPAAADLAVLVNDEIRKVSVRVTAGYVVGGLAGVLCLVVGERLSTLFVLVPIMVLSGGITVDSAGLSPGPRMMAGFAVGGALFAGPFTYLMAEHNSERAHVLALAWVLGAPVIGATISGGIRAGLSTGVATTGAAFLGAAAAGVSGPGIEEISALLGLAVIGGAVMLLIRQGFTVTSTALAGAEQAWVDHHRLRAEARMRIEAAASVIAGADAAADHRMDRLRAAALPLLDAVAAGAPLPLAAADADRARTAAEGIRRDLLERVGNRTTHE